MIKNKISKILISAGVIASVIGVTPAIITHAEGIKNECNYKIDANNQNIQQVVINKTIKLESGTAYKYDMAVITGANKNNYEVITQYGAKGMISKTDVTLVKNGENNKLVSINEFENVIHVTTNLNVREKPEVHAKLLATLKENSVVKVIGKEGEWFKVNINGQVGYAYDEFIGQENNSNQINNQEISNKSKTNISSVKDYNSKKDIQISNIPKSTVNRNTIIKPIVKAESTITPEPTVKPEVKPAVKPEPTVRPEVKPAVKPEPTVKPEVKPAVKPEPTVKPEVKPVVKPEPTVKPEVKPAVKPEPTVKPEVKPAVKPEPTVKPEVKPAVKPEPTVKPEVKPAVKPEPTVKPEVKPAVKPEPTVKPEVKPAVKPEPTVKPEIKPAVKPEPTVKPEVKPAVKPEPTVKPEVKPAVKPEPTVKPEVKPAVKPEPTVKPSQTSNKQGTICMVMKTTEGQLLKKEEVTGAIGSKDSLNMPQIPKGYKLVSMKINGKPATEMPSTFEFGTQDVVIVVAKETAPVRIVIVGNNGQGPVLYTHTSDMKVGNLMSNSLIPNGLTNNYHITSINVNGNNVGNTISGKVQEGQNVIIVKVARN